MKLNKLLLLLLLIFFISPDIFSQSSKEEIVNDLYDSITTEALTWIITSDRVPENKPDIADIRTLDGFEGKLKEDGGKKQYHPLNKVKEYIKTFTEHRGSLLEDRILTEADFESILKEPIYIKEILKNDAKYKAKSDSLDSYVKEEIREAFSKYRRIKGNKEVHQENKVVHEDDNQNHASYLPSEISNFFTYNILLILLITSVILNILQFFIRRKKRRKSQSSRSQVREKTRTIENIIKVGNAENFKPQFLSSGKVHQVIIFNYDNLKDELINIYHARAFEKENIKFQSLREGTIDLASNKTFNTENDLLNFLNDKLKVHKSILEEELKNYVSREKAIEEINSKIKSEVFYNGSNANYISIDEIDLKIEQMKKDYMANFPTTITRRDLDEDVLYMEKSIKTFIHKKIKASLELYMPFADTRGTIADNKKSNIPNRSSAIKLNINPNENTEATFQLLYEKSEMMQPAVVSYDTILLPICNLKNEDFNRNGNRIEQIGNDGKMRLEDGFWKVTEKLNIKIV